MNYFLKISSYIVFGLTIIISSCKKEDEVTAYDNSLGEWFFTSECEGNSADQFEDFLPNSINVEGEGDNDLSVLFLDSISIIASIDSEGIVIIPAQALFSIDTLGLTIPFEVSGSGLILSQEQGNLDLKYSLAIPLFPQEFSCVADLYRQENLLTEL